VHYESTSFKKKGRVLADTAPRQEVRQLSPEREIVQRLQYVLAEIDRLPLPTGRLGTQFLDCLELTDKIHEKARAKARALLMREPNALPGWRVHETGPVRELDRDIAAVFEALQELDDSLTLERFLGACSTSFSAIHKLLDDYDPKGIDHALREVTHHRDGSVRLIRNKEP
jgi:hypothetical protein